MEDREVYVCPVAETREDQCTLFQVEELVLGVIRRGGRVFAYENRCLHQGGPVCQGEVVGKPETILAPDRTVVTERLSREILHLVCPWHGWEYDLESGALFTDRRCRLKSFETVVRDGEVYVRV